MAQNMKRGRNQRRRTGPNVNRALDSNGPEVKIRGTAVQIYDKYQTLARDASSSGDRIRAESLQQHAEHYYRVMKAMQPPPQQQQSQPQNSDPASDAQPAVEAGSKSDESGDRPQRNTERTERSSGRERSKPKPAEPAEPAPAEAEISAKEHDQDEEKPKRTRRKRAPRKSVAEKESDTTTEVAAE